MSEAEPPLFRTQASPGVNDEANRLQPAWLAGKARSPARLLAEDVLRAPGDAYVSRRTA